jgi:uncharacterized delta-60 repeat protein
MISNKLPANLLLFVILFLATATQIFAADGDLDTLFDVDGMVLTDNGQVSEGIEDIVLQPDGKIVAIGDGLDSGATNRKAVLVRYNPDGSVDTSFGTMGKVSISAYIPGKLALQPDGKIIFVALLDNSATSDFYIARLNSNGSFDTTFNLTGQLLLDLRGTGDFARAVKIQPDGKIVVGGTSARVSPATGFDPAIVRLNPDGSLDTTFDGDGKAFSTPTPDRRDGLSDIALGQDGKILAAGISSTFNGQTYTFITIRFTSDGSLDTTFDGDGKVFTQVATGFGTLGTIAVQCDGKIVIAGTPTVNSFSKGSLVRYNYDGSLDSSFGSGGIMINAFESSALDLKFQADNKIVVGGTIGTIKMRFFAVYRYHPNGTLDTTFSGDGWNSIPGPFMSFSDANAVAIQPNGKIVTGGGTSQGSNGSDFILARWEATSGPANCTDKVADFDGDGRSDYSIYRNGLWAVRPSTNIDTFYAVEFGLATDKITPADFDGDGRTDIAVFRDGIWYLLRSTLGFTAIQFGQVEDVPVPADYDGDGRADVAVYRGGAWHILGSQSGYYAFYFGLANDKAVPGNYDSDGKTDPAVYRDGAWYMLRSQGGFGAVSFGLAADRPVARDYDGDGIADPAVYRNGVWYVLGSTQGFYAFNFGLSSDDPIPGDYDGDSKTDIAVFRVGTWYLQRSTLGFGAATLGVAGDRPVPGAYVPWSAPGPW